MHGAQSSPGAHVCCVKSERPPGSESATTKDGTHPPALLPATEATTGETVHGAKHSAESFALILGTQRSSGAHSC